MSWYLGNDCSVQQAMKTFIIACLLLTACHHSKPNNNPCLNCAKNHCDVEMSRCESVKGCEQETACLLSCSGDDVAFKLCAIQCLERATDEATEASKDFVVCFATKCEPTCAGESI